MSKTVWAQLEVTPYVLMDLGTDANARELKWETALDEDVYFPRKVGYLKTTNMLLNELKDDDKLVKRAQHAVFVIAVRVSAVVTVDFLLERGVVDLSCRREMGMALLLMVDPPKPMIKPDRPEEPDAPNSGANPGSSDPLPRQIPARKSDLHLPSSG
ncbi:hypothetical protein CSOJ01_14271 [Colletotrichum sojae]|uniref:Uncharacterized protein n=1 Tax=Colletotrichum sojae TaxID=2175907 RepID=A0A8H6IQ72_9PEZI|nr:hypothetical protein CSOJ01_14271 [Colletotrichum sojae]